jgi:hypothetical protein
MWHPTELPIVGGFQGALQGEYDTFVTKLLPSWIRMG